MKVENSINVCVPDYIDSSVSTFQVGRCQPVRRYLRSMNLIKRDGGESNARDQREVWGSWSTMPRLCRHLPCLACFTWLCIDATSGAPSSNVSAGRRCAAQATGNREKPWNTHDSRQAATLISDFIIAWAARKFSTYTPTLSALRPAS